ncbi:MAG: hypothetical protein RIC81_01150 [Microcella pacifica]|jgi:hypothetical protein|uniref:Uncharacterized protein n=1 Tax=Microcella pacifica TaxID=2591847 RepID=A0A9E5JRW1_9MICO|nr:hypothetical protein [Microcella pacifica]NHF63821.1 hypothetical protein [Microcella pacifica]
MKKDGEDLSLPGDKKPAYTMNRLALWIVVGAFGAYLLLSGIFGMLARA